MAKTDVDDEYGLKPSELYGKNTWKIKKFSQISKREFASSVFEIGGYSWYMACISFSSLIFVSKKLWKWF
jgi:hypothetical protein